MTKLTGRQRAFLSQFLDLYHEAGEQLHYADVAQQLGVGKVTAYDMLRLLEEHGLVQSEYILRGEGRGAGRSSIVFRPTTRAHALIGELSENMDGVDEWEQIRARVLEFIQSDKSYRTLLEELLHRVPEQESPMLYAAELVTAIILCLQELHAEAATFELTERMRSLGLPADAILNALAGVIVGLSFVEGINRRLVRELQASVQKFQEIIATLSSENKERLVSLADEIAGVVTG